MSQRIVDYKVIINVNLQNFESDIIDYLNSGWSLHGNLQQGRQGEFIQAIIRVDTLPPLPPLPRNPY